MNHIVTWIKPDGTVVGRNYIATSRILARGHCEFREVAAIRERIMRQRGEFVIPVWTPA